MDKVTSNTVRASGTWHFRTLGLCSPKVVLPEPRGQQRLSAGKMPRAKCTLFTDFYQGEVWPCLAEIDFLGLIPGEWLFCKCTVKKVYQLRKCLTKDPHSLWFQISAPFEQHPYDWSRTTTWLAPMTSSGSLIRADLSTVLIEHLGVTVARQAKSQNVFC